MNDKPSFSEFLISSKQDIVKRKDGSFYKAKNFKKAKGLYIGVYAFMTVVLLLIHIFTIYPSRLWPSRIIDFLIILQLASFLCIYLWYRFTRYERIP